MTQRRKLHTALALTPEQKGFIDGDREQRKSDKPLCLEPTGTQQSPRQSLVPLTTRITHRTAEALRRAYLEQKLADRLPDTQQEIVEAAQRQWLAENDFLK